MINITTNDIAKEIDRICDIETLKELKDKYPGRVAVSLKFIVDGVAVELDSDFDVIHGADDLTIKFTGETHGIEQDLSIARTRIIDYI